MRTTNGVTPTKQTSLAPQASTEMESPIEFVAANGNKVALSVALTRKYFCPAASEAEAYIFNSWCAHNNLDPWKKEAYLVKYGDQPPQMLTAKDAFTRRAQSNPRYQGQKAGVVIINRKGEIENRLGELVLEGEELVGGWADVYVKDYIEPISAVLSLKERMQVTRDGKPMAKWATSPALMIRKCALVAALREAFPSDVGGMYTADEMPIDLDEDTAATKATMQNAVDGVFKPVEQDESEAQDVDSLFEEV
ncbi:MAG: phage recombination protein Bet [Bacteroidales bacterium]|nr:phage recombination protein Bet [Bacteroidales bacterium]